MADGEVLLRGSWLYGGTVPTQVLVQAGTQPFPAPEDDPDSAESRQNPNAKHYFVVWFEPGNPARAASEVGSFTTLREARAHAESVASQPIHWDGDPASHEKVGIALETLHMAPLHGLRHPSEGDTSGWYIWGGGDISSRDDFFKPLHVAHLRARCPSVLPYLALSPGSRFLLADAHEDIWRDASLLLPDSAS